MENNSDDIQNLFSAMNITSNNAKKMMNKSPRKKRKKVIKKEKNEQTKKELNWNEISNQVLEELNKYRLNPKSLIPRLEFILNNMKNNVYYPPNSKIGLIYKEGKSVITETIQFLKKQKTVKKMERLEQLDKAAKIHVDDQSISGNTGHNSTKNNMKPAERINSIKNFKWNITCGENIMYGRENGRDIVAALIIDDGVKSRGHRKNMFSEEYKFVGISGGTHPKYRTMCVLDFVGGYTIENEEKI